MDEALYVQLLNLAAGFLLFPAVLALWRRELSGIIHVLALQGFALAGLTAVRAADQGSVELWGVAAGLLVLRAGVLPFLLRRVLTQNGPERRETTPLMNVVASLLTAALLTLDRKSTRLNSSHVAISYAVLCLKKKKQKRENPS